MRNWTQLISCKLNIYRQVTAQWTKWGYQTGISPNLELGIGTISWLKCITKFHAIFFQGFYVVKGFRFYWKLHVVFQNHNISVIIKNGRVYQEFIFFMSPCDLMALLKKTVWRQDWLCIKSLYLSVVQRIIASIFPSAMITQSFSFFSKQRMLCIEPSLLHEFNILPLHWTQLLL